VLAVRGLDMTSVDDFNILEDNYRGQQPYGDGYVHAGFYKVSFVYSNQFLGFEELLCVLLPGQLFLQYAFLFMLVRCYGGSGTAGPCREVLDISK
jgi:hypothetical protein